MNYSGAEFRRFRPRRQALDPVAGVSSHNAFIIASQKQKVRKLYYALESLTLDDFVGLKGIDELIRKRNIPPGGICGLLYERNLLHAGAPCRRNVVICIRSGPEYIREQRLKIDVIAAQ